MAYAPLQPGAVTIQKLHLDCNWVMGLYATELQYGLHSMPDTAACLHRVDSLQALTQLDWTRVQAALWNRRLPTASLASFRRLTDGQAFAISVCVDPRQENPARVVRHIPELRPWLSSVPLIGDELARAEIAADLVVICAAMSQLTGSWALHVRISVVDYADCAKFHTDHVTLRAVCTYAGDSTEYLPEPFVNRDALARASKDGWPPHRANRAICRALDGIVRPAPGDVLWLRGSAFPGALTPAAVHRSPASRTTGGTRRLLLSVDAQAARS